MSILRKILPTLAFCLLLTASCDTPAEQDDTEQTTPVVVEHLLNFEVSPPEGAYISGIASQSLLIGERSTQVEAVAAPGYSFLKWSDGEKNPVRRNITVSEDTTLTALFAKTSEDVPVLRLTMTRGVTSRENPMACLVTVENTIGRFQMEKAPATIRGRGNSSWGFQKKSYSLKLMDSAKLCGLGEGKSKNWVLSANHCDQSFLRNYMGYWLQRQLTGIPWGQECRHVELYINDIYQGVYLLSEKISADENKIDILTADDTGRLDAPFLLELDNYAGQTGEKGVTWFTVSGYPYLIKGEDNITRERNTWIDETLTKIYNVVVDGREQEVEKVLDLDSAVDIYLLEEIAKNIDCGWSSFYLYMGDDGKLVLGPAWDFDIAMGNDYRLDNGSYEKIYAGDRSYGFSQQNPWFLELMGQQWFVDRVAERLRELIDSGVFTKMEEEIDRVWGNIAPSLTRNFETWPIFGNRIFNETDEILTFDTPEEHVFFLKDWLVGRVAWLKEYFLGNQ